MADMNVDPVTVDDGSAKLTPSIAWGVFCIGVPLGFAGFPWLLALVLQQLQTPVFWDRLLSMYVELLPVFVSGGVYFVYSLKRSEYEINEGSFLWRDVLLRQRGAALTETELNSVEEGYFDYFSGDQFVHILIKSPDGATNLTLNSLKYSKRELELFLKCLE